MVRAFSVIDDYDDEIGIKDNTCGDVIVLTSKNANNKIFVDNCVYRLNTLYTEAQNRKKLNNLLEGFLLDKGYTFEDIKNWAHEKMQKESDG